MMLTVLSIIILVSLFLTVSIQRVWTSTRLTLLGSKFRHGTTRRAKPWLADAVFVSARIPSPDAI